MQATRPDQERLALNLSLRDWLVVALLVLVLLAAAPSIPFRPRAPRVERDYRIPFALSSRYDVYRRYTTLAADQFATLLVGDSVVWGQCSLKTDTLAHHLNELTKQPRFANCGLDGMHPIALADLLEFHAPAIARTRVLVQFDPLWMMEELRAEKGHVTLYNRPDLVPRLAAHFTGPFRETASLSWSHLMRNSPLKDWGERLADTRVDFLAWSLDHPYESPLRAISSTLPPSEDLHRQRLVRWDEHPTLPMDSSWSSPDESEQWKAFRRILSLLERRGNRVLVVLGPMNEHMMDIPTRTAYGKLKAALLADLAKDGVRVFAPSLLDSAHYADICHPLGPGYDSLARELLLKESAWMLGLDETR